MRFHLRKRVIRVTRWVFRRFRTRPGYQRLGDSISPARKPITKLLNWGRRLFNSGSGYMRVGSDPVQDQAPTVPKGQLAVYVGQKDGEFHRVLVPVIYFNHPLFCELLREAEKEYGFHHPGGITIPCRVTEFERVKTRIASGSGGYSGGRRLGWRRHW